MTRLPPGLNGIDGEEIPESTDIDYLTGLGYNYLEGKESGPGYEINKFLFNGYPGIRGTDGGHGGCGGPGGPHGNAFIFGFKDSDKILVSSKNGKILLVLMKMLQN